MDGLAGNIHVKRGSGRGLVLTLCAVQFLDVMGVTVVVTALPQMVADLGGGPAGAAAVVTAYAMAFGGLLMLASRVGDRYGHRRVLLWSTVGFCLASAAAGLAGSIWILAMARGAQGAAASASVPAALRLLTTLVPRGGPRQRAVAAWSAAGAGAGASGFILGGAFTQWVSWRAVFVVMAVLGLALVLATSALVPSSDRPESPPRIPWAAGLAVAVAVAALVVGTTLLGDVAHRVAGLAMLVLALAAGCSFGLLERACRPRLVPPLARSSRNVLWGSAVSAANTATTSSSITLATLYLQGRLHLAPVRAAGTLLPFSVLVMVAATCAPMAIRTQGWARAATLGLLVIATGNLVMAWAPDAFGIAAASAVCGLGIGIASVAATDMGATVGTSAKSAAAAMVNTAAQSGTAVGTAAALLLADAIDTRRTWVVVAVTAVGTAITVLLRSPVADDAGRRNP